MLGAPVKTSLDDNEVKLAQDQINAVNVLMREYINSPETSRFRLEESIVKSAVANETLERLLPTSASGYVLGVLVRLSALQELANISASENEHKNVSSYAYKCLPALNNSFDQLIVANDHRVSGFTTKIEHRLVVDFGVTIERERPEPKKRVTYVYVSYSVDGVSRQFTGVGERNSEDEDKALVATVTNRATAARDRDVERVRTDFMSQVGIPLLQSIKTIEEISKL